MPTVNMALSKCYILLLLRQHIRWRDISGLLSQEFEAKEPTVVSSDPDAPRDRRARLAEHGAQWILGAAEALEGGGSGETGEYKERRVGRASDGGGDGE